MKITIEELAKGNANHFKKVADQNAAISKAHSDLAAQTKSKAETLDDGDAEKALLLKTVDFHTALATSHKAISESALENSVVKEEVTPIAVVPAPVVKAAGEPVDASASTGVDGMVEKAVAAVLSKALDTVQTSGKVEEMVEKMVCQKVAEALGNKMVPTDVHGVLPGHQAVQRPGQPAAPVAATELPAELAFLGE